MRETFNALLRILEVGDAVNVNVPHAQQRYESEIPLPGTTNATARIAFRFARNLHPELGDRAKELLQNGIQGTGMRGLVVGSGLWDLNPGQGGGGHTTALTTYAIRLAKFLREMGLFLKEKREEGGGPYRLVWRMIAPTVWSKAPIDRRDFLSNGRIEACNAIARRFLGEAWNFFAVSKMLPPWALVESSLLMPPGHESRVSGDGYHPTPQTLERFVHAIASEFCPEHKWDMLAIHAIAAVDNDW